MKNGNENVKNFTNQIRRQSCRELTEIFNAQESVKTLELYVK